MNQAAILRNVAYRTSIRSVSLLSVYTIQTNNAYNEHKLTFRKINGITGARTHLWVFNIDPAI
jgi:hypothetical protein